MERAMAVTAQPGTRKLHLTCFAMLAILSRCHAVSLESPFCCGEGWYSTTHVALATARIQVIKAQEAGRGAVQAF